MENLYKDKILQDEINCEIKKEKEMYSGEHQKLIEALKLGEKQNQTKKRMKSANKIVIKGITNLKYNLI